MAIIYAREIPKERTATGNYKDGYKYKRAFFVRTDSPTESLTDISNAPGIAFQDLHPNYASAMMHPTARGVVYLVMALTLLSSWSDSGYLLEVRSRLD